MITKSEEAKNLCQAWSTLCFTPELCTHDDWNQKLLELYRKISCNRLLLFQHKPSSTFLACITALRISGVQTSLQNQFLSVSLTIQWIPKPSPLILLVRGLLTIQLAHGFENPSTIQIFPQYTDLHTFVDTQLDPSCGYARWRRWKLIRKTNH